VRRSRLRQFYLANRNLPLVLVAGGLADSKRGGGAEGGGGGGGDSGSDSAETDQRPRFLEASVDAAIGDGYNVPALQALLEGTVLAMHAYGANVRAVVVAPLLDGLSWDLVRPEDEDQGEGEKDTKSLPSGSYDAEEEFVARTDAAALAAPGPPGLSHRGLVLVEDRTLERIPKTSFYWLKHLIYSSRTPEEG
jgi:hypothetical protein